MHNFKVILKCPYKAKCTFYVKTETCLYLNKNKVNA